MAQKTEYTYESALERDQRLQAQQAAAGAMLAALCKGRQKLATYTSVYKGDKELRELLKDWDAAIAAAEAAWSEIQAQANGYLVVSQHVDCMGRLGSYDYDHESDITGAADMWAMLEDGEFKNYHPRAIIPCRDGIPCGPQLPSALVGQLTREGSKS